MKYVYFKRVNGKSFQMHILSIFESMMTRMMTIN